MMPSQRPSPKNLYVKNKMKKVLFWGLLIAALVLVFSRKSEGCACGVAG